MFDRNVSPQHKDQPNQDAPGFEGMVNLDCAGHAGGLALLWKKAEEFFLLGFSQNHIDMAVLENNTPQWRIMGFYGHPDRSQRGVTWDLLRMLSTTLDLPWCVIGDFNDICNNEEKRGTIPHPPQLIRNFYEALHDCHVDLNTEINTQYFKSSNSNSSLIIK